MSFDPVKVPEHYNTHPSGIEPITITQHLNFCLGNVIKYVMRCDLKGNALQDLRKAQTYLTYEISRREALVDTHMDPASPSAANLYRLYTGEPA